MFCLYFHSQSYITLSITHHATLTVNTVHRLYLVHAQSASEGLSSNTTFMLVIGQATVLREIPQSSCLGRLAICYMGLPIWLTPEVLPFYAMLESGSDKSLGYTGR